MIILDWLDLIYKFSVKPEHMNMASEIFTLVKLSMQRQMRILGFLALISAV